VTTGSMALLRAFLVDDEPLAVKRLTRLLLATGRVEVVGSCTLPEEAADLLKTSGADVLFLDIEMPGMNGFELAASLDPQPFIVFTTAYDRYALRAFDVNSIDYLLKPIDPARLERALAKLERLRGHGPQPWAQRPEIRQAVEDLALALGGGRRDYPSRVVSRSGQRALLLDVGEITHFFSESKLSFGVVRGRRHCVDESINALERRLDPRRFLRIHRAILVNLDWVAEVDAWSGGGGVVRLRDEGRTELDVARDRMRALKQRLGM
jgi:two-component system LytT family response regulator